MYLSHHGGLITAVSPSKTAPLHQLGEISILKRIVLSMQQANLFPIVVVTDTDHGEIVHQLSGEGVVFLSLSPQDGSDMFSAVKLGLRFLVQKCQRVLITPVTTPLFMPQTLSALLAQEGAILSPVFQGRAGHPVLVSRQVIFQLLDYSGEGGLRGALSQLADQRVPVPVNDEGVVLNIRDEAQAVSYLQTHNLSLLSPSIQLSIGKEGMFMNARLKLLLYLIQDLSSVRQACLHMGLSYSKAWQLINALEQEVGYAIVTRQHGGAKGGHTMLTQKGLDFLAAYQRFESRLQQYAADCFREEMIDTHILPQQSYDNP